MLPIPLVPVVVLDIQLWFKKKKVLAFIPVIEAIT